MNSHSELKQVTRDDLIKLAIDTLSDEAKKAIECAKRAVEVATSGKKEIDKVAQLLYSRAFELTGNLDSPQALLASLEKSKECYQINARAIAAAKEAKLNAENTQIKVEELKAEEAKLKTEKTLQKIEELENQIISHINKVDLNFLITREALKKAELTHKFQLAYAKSIELVHEQWKAREARQGDLARTLNREITQNQNLIDKILIEIGKIELVLKKLNTPLSSSYGFFYSLSLAASAKQQACRVGRALTAEQAGEQIKAKEVMEAFLAGKEVPKRKRRRQ